jgi:REP element-mobilizing transposase RayT
LGCLSTGHDENLEQGARRSIRLAEYDYSRDGAYFVTVCAHGRECLFGSIADYAMALNALGQIAASEWLRTHALRPNVLLDEFVVMPNHFHGIIVITSSVGSLSPKQDLRPDAHARGPLRSPSQTVGAIVRGWKGAVTKQINDLRGTSSSPVWQRNFYEHVIRNEQDMQAIREYIVSNPTRWDDDEQNPSRETSQRT